MERQELTLTPELASLVDSFSQLAANLPKQMGALCAEIEATEVMMRQLVAQGIVRAVPDWRLGTSGEYLTLVFLSDTDGKRYRKYVGSDPGKIKEALIGLDRAEEYDRLQGRLYRMMKGSMDAITQVSQARDALVCCRR